MIRPDGTVESAIPLFTAGYLERRVPLITDRTPGTVLGEPTRWVLAVATPLVLAWWSPGRPPPQMPARPTRRR